MARRKLSDRSKAWIFLALTVLAGALMVIGARITGGGS